jgi:hypothetical protein
MGTVKSQLAQPEKPKTKPGMSKEDIANLEEEMETLERDLKAVEESYAGRGIQCERSCGLDATLGSTRPRHSQAKPMISWG